MWACSVTMTVTPFDWVCERVLIKDPFIKVVLLHMHEFNADKRYMYMKKSLITEKGIMGFQKFVLYCLPMHPCPKMLKQLPLSKYCVSLSKTSNFPHTCLHFMMAWLFITNVWISPIFLFAYMYTYPWYLFITCIDFVYLTKALTIFKKHFILLFN